MSWGIISLVILCILLLLIFTGVPIGFALGATSLFGLILFVGPSSLSSIPNVTWGAVNEFVLTAVPLFLLMSEIITFTGIGKDMFEALQKWTSKIPGGLAISSIIACAIFGAVSGTGVGVAAVVGILAIPEMAKRGYNPLISTGSIAGASALGMVIPPSLPLILYGVVTELSVGDLFIAGVIPGLLLMTLYSVYVFFAARKINKNSNQVVETYSLSEKLKALLNVLPILTLIIVIIGGIYIGIMTPTEAAGVGVFLSLVIAAIYRKLTLKNLWTALINATKMSAMVFIILIGAMLFGYLLGTTQIPQNLSNWIISLDASRWVIFSILMIVFLFLGMFLEVTSIVLITLPIVYPIITGLGFDPIWFAIVLMVNMCAAVVSPPVGLVSYVVKKAAGDSVPLNTVFKGIIPFVIIDLFVIVLLCIFPEIALFLVK
ncbi:MAG: TRAP transporter large permease [Bacillota bacterium]